MQFHPKDLSELDELTEEHLGFSALSEGLGFTKQSKRAPQAGAAPPAHPARPSASGGTSRGPSMGLAPQKPLESFDAPATNKSRDAELQRKAFSGTGAVAAGPARPAPMPMPASRPSATVGTAPVSRPAASHPVPTRPVTATTTARAVPPVAAGTSVLSEPAASREIRVAAFLIDFFIVFTPMAFGWWLSFHSRAVAIFNQDRRAPLALFGLIFAVYFLLSESFGGQSLGKMLLGLRVVEDDKYEKPTGLQHAAKRLFLFVVGASLGGIGLLASFWDAKRRPWHDRYSGSIVRQKV